MSNGNHRIQVASNIPGLAEKVQKNITGSTDNIYWYIRFNIPLDEASVSDGTMSVTDTDGYFMRTDISYDNSRHMIMISPLDTYEQDVFYLLHVSKKVKSMRGNNLKQPMYILFKLTDNQISEFKTLKSTAQVPAVKKRPKNYDAIFKEKIKTAARVYSFTDTPFQKAKPDKLPTANVKINLWFGFAGLAVLLLYVFLQNFPVLMAGAFMCAAGTAHIAVQLGGKSLRSVIAYNAGVRQFNKENFKQADYKFQKAHLLDPENEMAEYAVNKIVFYR